MIHPLYFPYTHLTDAERSAIRACFDYAMVFSPLEGTVEEGPGLMPRVPVRGHDDELSAMLREYRHFASMNINRASSYLKGADTRFFYDADWSSELRNEIMRHAGEGTSSRDQAGSDSAGILWARFFLHIAHEYDEKNREIDQELDQVALNEKKLIKNLMGEDDGDDEGLIDASAQSQAQSAEGHLMSRMEAWATVFLAAEPDPEITGRGFFLTTRSDVIDMLDEFAGPLERVASISMENLDRGRVSQTIETLLDTADQSDVPEQKNTAVKQEPGLTLFRASNIPPKAFFSRFSKRRIAMDDTGITNTIIGLIRV